MSLNQELHSSIFLMLDTFVFNVFSTFPGKKYQFGKMIFLILCKIQCVNILCELFPSVFLKLDGIIILYSLITSFVLGIKVIVVVASLIFCSLIVCSIEELTYIVLGLIF